MVKQARFSRGQKWFLFAGVPGVIIGAVMALFLVVIPSGSQDPTVAWDPSVVVTAPNAGVDLPLESMELSGTWIANTENGANLTATVQADTIEIVMENEGASMTYWFGTFLSSADVGATIVSDKLEADKLVMSRATSKDFTIGADMMSFDLTAMGVTTTVEMSRA